MSDLTQKQKERLNLLEQSLGIKDENGLILSGVANTKLCASLEREENLQYHFMLIYQGLVLVLAMTVLALLIFAAWRIASGEEAYQAAIAGAGALVSGTAAAFLLGQRADARDSHDAAQAGLAEHCSD